MAWQSISAGYMALIWVGSALLALLSFGVSLGSNQEGPPSAYVTNISSNSVSVIDTGTNRVVEIVEVGAGPRGVAITPDGTRAYVANQNSDTVSVIDKGSNIVVKTLTVCCGPRWVAILVNGTRVYIGNVHNSSVAVIDTATDTVVATVRVGRRPLS